MISKIRRIISLLFGLGTVAIAAGTENEDDELVRFADEYSAWYKNIFSSAGVLPVSISGISKDDKQFVIQIERTHLNYIERNEFIRFILDREKSVTFAYGSLTGTPSDDGEEIMEELSIIAASATEFVWQTWRVVRGENQRDNSLIYLKTMKGKDPEKFPVTWFLAKPLTQAEKSNKDFEHYWTYLRKSALFMDRRQNR